MAWIDGTERRTYDIEAPIDKVYEFLTNPLVRKDAILDIERFEKIDDATCRWIMREKREKGITFRGDYTVRYEGNGRDRAQWGTVGTGTMRTRGSASLRAKGPTTTEVRFEEKIESDIPLPSLMAKVIKPIVAREIRAGVQGFLDRMKTKLERG